MAPEPATADPLGSDELVALSDTRTGAVAPEPGRPDSPSGTGAVAPEPLGCGDLLVMRRVGAAALALAAAAFLKAFDLGSALGYRPGDRGRPAASLASAAALILALPFLVPLSLSNRGCAILH